VRLELTALFKVRIAHREKLAQSAYLNNDPQSASIHSAVILELKEILAFIEEMEEEELLSVTQVAKELGYPDTPAGNRKVTRLIEKEIIQARKLTGGNTYALTRTEMERIKRDDRVPKEFKRKK
jgi:hypothetical protein